MNFKKLKKKFKKKRKEMKRFRQNTLIYREYYNASIDDNLVYVESRDGNDFTGNILRIVEELSTGKYGDFKIQVYAKPKVHSKIKKLSENYSLKIDKIISVEDDAVKTLEKAKYIVSDSGMRRKYVKKEGQIFLDTWHGTPLKTMGIHNRSEEHRCANIQQVFFACDYLLYPNDYMKDKMINSYMMSHLYKGKILLEGYPRNSVFFNENKGIELKNKLGFSDKELFAYMPTFKGVLLNRKDDEQKDTITEYLNEIDDNLNDDQVLLVKLHPFNQEQIDFSLFNHVQAFPEGYEIYDVLNMVDCLVTDYSSVFFDYANTRRKIIIFNYDEEEYMQDRGTYFPLSDLPFPKVQTVSDLVHELNAPKNYDDEEFVGKFCTYDNADAIENVCRHVFTNQKVCREEVLEDNGKDNILIFAGGLAKNGITSSLLGVLSHIDRSQYNIFISYRPWEKSIKREHRRIFDLIPDDVEFAPLRSPINMTLREKRAYNKFLNSPKGTELPEVVRNLFRRELKRSFNYFPLKTVINFNGYNNNQTLLFNEAPTTNSLWVHNDMIQEIKTRNNQQYSVLYEVYNNYTNICAVSPDLVGQISKISGKKDNVKVVHNINDYESILDKASKEIVYDEHTSVVCHHPDGIEGVLNSPGKKFITIGRFSPEKGHARLIKAFDQFCQDYPDTQLIIIGGHGRTVETKQLVESCKYGENITLIKNMFNPMPILDRCDLFVVSSFYEGWPMVIMEADTLGVPIIATDISGTQWMKGYNGNIVDNSQEGILQGMHDFMQGNIHDSLGIDYEQYNKDAVNEFLEVMK